MEERILKILEEQCEEVLDYDGDNMMEDGVIDSFTVLDIINGLEEEFDIEIANEEAEKIATVGDAVEQIKNALN